MVFRSRLVLLIRRAALVAPILAVAGCAQLFFYPTSRQVLTPADLGLAYHDVWFDAADGTRLHGWFLPAEGTARATIVYLHGNAENISTHILSVSWLPAAGYNVFAFDYRGYGLSAGTPSFAGIHMDAEAAFEHVFTLDGVGGRPVAALGDSLGGSVAITQLARSSLQERYCMLIVQAGFAGYRRIVEDKLAAFWLTSALRRPLSAGIDTGFDPADAIGRLSPLPVLILHGDADEVVPLAHGVALYEAAGTPKELWVLEGTRHNQALFKPDVRAELLQTLGERCS